MSDLVKPLKKNDKPFGLMSEAMQAKANEIGVGEFSAYLGIISGDWKPAEPGQGFLFYRTYRLRSDYEEKPDVIEYEIKPDGQFLKFYHRNVRYELSVAPTLVDFFGFKYSDGHVSPMERKYKRTSDGSIFDNMNIDDMETRKLVIPTHVVFQAK